MICMYLQVEWKIVDHDQLGLHCFKNRNVMGYISLLSYRDLLESVLQIILTTISMGSQMKLDPYQLFSVHTCSNFGLANISVCI